MKIEKTDFTKEYLNDSNLEKSFKIRVLKIFRETIVDGFGLRYSIYFSGCPHRCPGCHNEYSWNPENGELLTYEKLEEMVNEINGNTLLDGITISGGDPLYNPEEMLKVLKYLKKATGKNIWLYTGYTLEEVKENEARNACLEFIDVLVDGPFIKELYSPYLKFRGSENQRIIKVKDVCK